MTIERIEEPEPVDRPVEGKMLRPREVGARLGLTSQTVKAIPVERLPYTRVNERGDRRYRPEDVDAYLASRRVG